VDEAREAGSIELSMKPFQFQHRSKAGAGVVHDGSDQESRASCWSTATPIPVDGGLIPGI
jgi:hypothetical protein